MYRSTEIHHRARVRPPCIRMVGSVGVMIAMSIVSSDVARAQSPGFVGPVTLADIDRIRLAEARRLIAAVQDSVWPGWSSAPSALLLVTPEREFLLWHPRPSAEFERIGHDSLLASDVYSRPRQFSPNMLATFPAVGGVPTVVVGTAEQTGKGSTAWVLTIAHEHFHQMQTSRADYHARVAALELTGGDNTGMWMLNYPFPYTTPAVSAEFDRVARALREALRDTVAANQQRHAAAIADARQALRGALQAPDHRYLDFQMWQEGIARYTEYAVAQVAARRYEPTAAFRALPDDEAFGVAAERMRRQILETESVSFTNQRVAFYPVGAALGLWLDRVDPAWRKRYFESPLTLEAPPG